MPSHARHISLLGLLCTGALFVGCASGQPAVPPSARIHEAVDGSAAVLRSYFREVTDFERRIFLDDLLATGQSFSQAALTTQPASLPSPLGGKFRATDLQVRLEGLSLTAVYLRRLAEYVGTDDPLQILTRPGGSSDADLLTSCQMPETAEPVDVESYSKPTMGLRGMLGSRMRQGDFEAGGRLVDQIITLLRRDLTDSRKSIERLGRSQLLAGRMKAYNEGLDPAHPSNSQQRQRALADIDLFLQRYERLVAVDPDELMDGICRLRVALYKLTLRGRRPEDIPSALANLEQLESRLRRNTDAAAEVRELRKSEQQP